MKKGERTRREGKGGKGRGRGGEGGREGGREREGRRVEVEKRDKLNDTAIRTQCSIRTTAKPSSLRRPQE